MFVMYFTEQPMSTYPADIGLDTGHTALMFSNKHFDPVAGSRLYNDIWSTTSTPKSRASKALC